MLLLRRLVHSGLSPTRPQYHYTTFIFNMFNNFHKIEKILIGMLFDISVANHTDAFFGVPADLRRDTPP